MGRLLTLLRQKGDFSPLDLPGLALWLDASDESTITASSGAVSQWDDKSGNANHVTQGTAAYQPVTGTRTVNSKNVLDFDGTDDILTNADIGISGTTNRTLFVVGFSDINTGLGNLLSMGDTVDANDQFGCTWEMAIRVSTQNAVYSASMYPSAAIGVFGLDGSGIADAFARKDGTALTVLSSTDTGGSLNTDAGFGVGDSLGGGTGDPFNGVIAEVRVYDSALSIADIEANEADLATKWGITL